MKYTHEHIKNVGTINECYIQRYPNINYEKKYIFVHPPRCAGKSVEFCLFNKKPISGSADHRLICQHREIIGKDFDKFTSFSFCRNPFDRLVSTYEHRKRKFKDSDPTNVSFKDWIMKQQHPDSWGYSVPPLSIEKGKYFTQRSQVDYISDPSTRNICVDYIGRFENIKNDWKFICREILKENIELSHLNGSIRKDYREYYDQEMREFVYKLWEKDLDTFKYIF